MLGEVDGSASGRSTGSLRTTPVATYRVQLSSRFRFDDLIDELDYLRELGVSHVYVSPILQASPGSEHGYDVVDSSRVSEELGGEERFRRLSRELSARGMAMLVDIVPNHMSIAGPDNLWWQDVLENGPSSRYARFFDIEWASGDGSGKVLAPILPDHYGRTLDDEGIRLGYDAAGLHVSCAGRRMPLAPESVGELLCEAARLHPVDELEFLAQSLRRLPQPESGDAEAVERRDRDKRLLYRLLERLATDQPGVRSAINQVVEAVNADPGHLDGVLRAQNYRLGFWRLAAQQLGYRRFFDVNTLVALRAESREVFEATHETLLRLFYDGCFEGMRVDHVDGLRKPADYLRRLREAAPEAWILVEKILEPDEDLRRDWPIDGTTGYDFGFEVGNLFVDRSAQQAFTSLYCEVAGDRRPYAELARESKRRVLRELLGSDLRRLVGLFERVCDDLPRYRDYLQSELQEALECFLAALPAYRTYVDADRGTSSEQDVRYFEEAVEWAKRLAAELDPRIFDLLRDLMRLRIRGAVEADFVMRLQQLSGPATAKGVEDTAFYCYHRLVALNEVGGDPGRFGISLKEFHERARKRRERTPFGLLATSTHDSKRSEDVRVRITALTEIPQRWADAVRTWVRAHDERRIGGAPDRKLEYLFYQTVVGAWPIDAERAIAYMLKAARESKEYTSWTRVDEAYEEALRKFFTSILEDDVFQRQVEDLLAEILPTARISSLAQTLIKLTAPGVPDIYQGTELWALHLVDPDNRRPVDYALRRESLRMLDDLSPRQILERADEGLPKLWVIRQALALRRERPAVFGKCGGYRALPASGVHADCLVGYLRGENVAVLAPRLPRRTAEGWGDTTVELPAGRWRCRLSGHAASGGAQRVESLLRAFPVGLFVEEGGE